MPKARKHKNRNRVNIPTYSKSRYYKFRSLGFTDVEAKWAAEEALSFRDDNVKRIVKFREANILFYTKYHNKTREEAIVLAARDLRTKLDVRNIKEMNLYYELSME